MYYYVKIKEKVGIHPKFIKSDLKQSTLDALREQYDGTIVPNIGLVVSVDSVDKIGDGKIVPGDANIYYTAEAGLIVYEPKIHETVEATISDIVEFGAFAKIGPVEGLVHVSQIMEDFINYDAKQAAFVGKKTKKKLMAKDNVIAKIVTVSMKGNTSGSKIGLTMRQNALGKEEWMSQDAKEKRDTTKKTKKKGGKK